MYYTRILVYDFKERNGIINREQIKISFYGVITMMEHRKGR